MFRGSRITAPPCRHFVGRTMLFKVAIHGWVKSGRAYILDREDDLDLNELCQDMTPLMVAAREGHVVICKMLLRAGADANVERKGKKARDMASNDYVRRVFDTLNLCWTRSAHFDHAIGAHPRTARATLRLARAAGHAS